MTPKTCKNFQKEEMISIKVTVFSTNPGVISREVDVFREGEIFRENGYLFEIMGEYSKKVRFI
jgi:hypothetical protein